MVETIKAYKDASGKIHEDVFTAHRADLAIWFARIDAISETSAKQMADRLAADLSECDDLIEMLKALRDNAPVPVAVPNYGPMPAESGL